MKQKNKTGGTETGKNSNVFCLHNKQAVEEKEFAKLYYYSIHIVRVNQAT